MNFFGPHSASLALRKNSGRAPRSGDPRSLAAIARLEFRCTMRAAHGARFDPGTAMLIAAGVGGASKIMGGVSQMQADDANAQTEGMNAQATLQASQARATQVGNQWSAQMGTALADTGASGITTSGSPLTIMSSMAAQGALAKQLTLWQGKTQAAAQTRQGQIDEWQGSQALMSGIIGGASTFTQGVATSNWMAPSPSNYNAPWNMQPSQAGGGFG